MTARGLTVGGIVMLLLAAPVGIQRGQAQTAGSAGTGGTDGAEPVAASVADTLPPDSIEARNALLMERLQAPVNAADDTLVGGNAALVASSDSLALTKRRGGHGRHKFIPDPRRALWLSLVLPGAGQIYNRKFWKIPIVYGGFLGCTYALMWNQQMYRDYSQAYLDIMDDDPNTKSYMSMLPPRYDITGREEYFKTIFKNKKNRYRRYRDLSVFCFIGVYILSVIDAYVDAQLSEFDITPDLSMSVAPTVLDNEGTARRTRAYGLGCSLRF